MFKLDNSTVTMWTAHKRTNFEVPFSINGPCPNTKCGRTPVTFPLSSQWEKRSFFAHAKSRCPACQKEARFLLIDPPTKGKKETRANVQLFIDPTPPLLADLHKEVAEVSPRFAETYRQAKVAEGRGLTELVGMGYRKALEFLIKDYLCEKKPEKQDAIQKCSLGQAIDNYVDDKRIQDCAKMASWLGNDETHYTKKWADKDLVDLKTLMRLTIHWIQMNLLTQSYKESMLQDN